MSRPPRPLILVALLGGFFLVLWLTRQVVETEFFRGSPELGGHATPVDDALTRAARRVCAAAAQREAAGGSAGGDETAWDLGFGRYLVRGRLTRAGGGPGPAYLCRLDRGPGDLADPAGWRVEHLEWSP